MDAETQPHLAVGDSEERFIRARQGAALERDPERARGGVRLLGHPDNVRKVEPIFGCGTCTLENREVPRDPATLALVTLRSAGYVVGDREVVRIDALAAQLGHGKAEVHHVARVVSGRQQHPGIAVCRAGDGGGLFRRG